MQMKNMYYEYYILGLLIADGFITKQGIISLEMVDLEIIEKVNRYFIEETPNPFLRIEDYG